MRNPVGRPKKYRAITKNGRAFMFWLENSQMILLDIESTKTGLSKAEIIRQLIQKYIQET